MKSELIILPYRTEDAFTNMADDILLLENFPRSDTLRWRNYGWSNPAYTFGYGQKYIQAKNKMGGCSDTQLCRRPTGGGLVDHIDDWTYSLFIPPGHPLYRSRPGKVYRIVHEALVESLRINGQPADLANNPNKTRQYDECFPKPAEHDAVNPLTNSKIAGCALKRNRHGLLLQGSVDRHASEAIGDWPAFAETFTQKLGETLKADPREGPWPKFPPDAVQAALVLFASQDWNLRR